MCIYVYMYIYISICWSMYQSTFCTRGLVCRLHKLDKCADCSSQFKRPPVRTPTKLYKVPPPSTHVHTHLYLCV